MQFVFSLLRKQQITELHSFVACTTQSPCAAHCMRRSKKSVIKLCGDFITEWDVIIIHFQENLKNTLFSSFSLFQIELSQSWNHQKINLFSYFPWITLCLVLTLRAESVVKILKYISQHITGTRSYNSTCIITYFVPTRKYCGSTIFNHWLLNILLHV